MKNKAYCAILILFFYVAFRELIVATILLYNNDYMYIGIYLCIFLGVLFALKVHVKMPIYFIIILFILCWGGFSFEQVNHAQHHYSVDMQANRVKSNLILIEKYVKPYVTINNKCPNSIEEVLSGENIKDPFTGNDYIITSTQHGCLILSAGPNKFVDKQYINVKNDVLPNYKGGSVWSQLYTNKLLLSINPRLGNENIDLAIIVTIARKIPVV